MLGGTQEDWARHEAKAGPWGEARLSRLSSAQGSHEGSGTVEVPRENCLTWLGTCVLHTPTHCRKRSCTKCSLVLILKLVCISRLMKEFWTEVRIFSSKDSNFKVHRKWEKQIWGFK